MKNHINERIENAHLYSETQLEEVVDLIIEYLLETQDDARTADDVGGQEGEYQGVVIADWHKVEAEWCQFLDSMGFAVYFPDEVITCDNNKVWEHDSNLWMVTDGGEILTKDDPIQDWIEECLVTDYLHPMKTLPTWVDESVLVDEGFTRISVMPYQNGFHPGQNDKPEQIAEHYLGTHDELVFTISSANPFEIRFHVWGR